MKFMLSLTCSILIATLLIGFLPVDGEEAIYDNVIRFHVLANSDSEDDQKLKLQVRDEVLGVVRKWLTDCKTVEDSRKVLEPRLDEIRTIAENCVQTNGYAYSCEVTLTTEAYPTRDYESIQFPAGEYCSLRIMIGEAEGRNWWCVLFPPLCLAAASETVTGGQVSVDDSGELMQSAGFTPKQVEILTDTESPKIMVKFKLLELFKSWFQ